MFLFDRNNDNIEIYTMKPINSKIKEFKEQEIAQIPKQQRILKIETNSKENLAFKNKFALNGKGKPIDISQDSINFEIKKAFDTEYHRLTTYEEYIDNDLLIKAYIENNYDDGQLARVFDYDSSKKRMDFIKYLLLNEYYLFNGRNKAFINHILNLPESLYLLELIKKEHFSLLDNKDISEQLKLFYISENPVKTYSLQELYELSIYGIAKNPVEKALDNVENCKSIFTRIRR